MTQIKNRKCSAVASSALFRLFCNSDSVDFWGGRRGARIFLAPRSRVPSLRHWQYRR